MSNVSPDEVHDVIAALKADLSAREISDTSLADERSAILGSWSNTHANPSCHTRHELPACRHLEAANAAGLIGPARQLTRAILPLLDSFHWRYGYPLTLRGQIYRSVSRSPKSLASAAYWLMTVRCWALL